MDVATKFFEACESGQGWVGCEEFATDGPASCQAVDAMPGPPVSEADTIAKYCDWMKGVCDAYKILSKAFDETTSTALFFGNFGGFSEYVYVMRVNDGKVCEFTKVWNDAYAAKIVSAAPAQ